MPTLVRQRGKRGLSKPESPVKATKHVRHHSKALVKPLPTLDALPTEILQEIYCYGTNLDLPLISRDMYAKLDGSQVIRENIVSRLLWADPSKNMYGGDLVSLHSNLLRRKWFDVKLIRRCKSNEALPIVWVTILDLQPVDPETTRLRLESFVNQVAERTADDCCWEALGPEFITRDERTFTVIFEHSEFSIWEEDDHVALEQKPKEPWLCRDTRLPAGLLHGTWTRENALWLHTIVDLLDHDPGHSPVESEGESDFEQRDEAKSRYDIEIAFHSAIRQRCLPVVTALIDPNYFCKTCFMTWVQPDGPLVDDKDASEEEAHDGGAPGNDVSNIDTHNEEFLSHLPITTWTCSLEENWLYQNNLAHIELFLENVVGESSDLLLYILLAKSELDSSPFGGVMFTKEMLMEQVLRAENGSTGERARSIGRMRVWLTTYLHDGDG